MLARIFWPTFEFAVLTFENVCLPGHQAESRLHRPGQAYKVRAYYLAASSGEARKYDIKQWNVLQKQNQSISHVHDGSLESSSELSAAVLEDGCLSQDVLQEEDDDVEVGRACDAGCGYGCSAGQELIAVPASICIAQDLLDAEEKWRAIFGCDTVVEQDTATNADNLRFLVSANSKRVHLYRFDSDDCTLHPCGNFDPDDLTRKSAQHTPLCGLPVCMMADTDTAQALTALVQRAVQQWDSMSSRARRKLGTDPVSLPLPAQYVDTSTLHAVRAVFGAARQAGASAAAELGCAAPAPNLSRRRNKLQLLDDAYYDECGLQLLSGNNCSSQSSCTSSTEGSSCSDSDEELPIHTVDRGVTMPIRKRAGTVREILCRRRFELSHDLQWAENENIRMVEVKIERQHIKIESTTRTEMAAVLKTAGGTEQITSPSSTPPSSTTDAEDETAEEYNTLVQPMDGSSAMCAWCGTHFEIRYVDKQQNGMPQEEPSNHAILHLKRLDDMFCSANCTMQALVQTNQSKHIRALISKRDDGRCELCKLDCKALVKALKKLPAGEERRRHILTVSAAHPCGAAAAADRGTINASQASQAVRDLGWGGQANAACLEKLCAGHGLAKRVREGDVWEVDHVQAVHLGGGQCCADNLRLLCRPCHKNITAAQHTERSHHAHRKRNRAVADGTGVAICSTGTATGGCYALSDSRMCKAARSVKQQSRCKMPVSARSARQVDLAAKLWTCSECGNAANSLSRPVCGMCASKRPNLPTVPSSL